MSFEEKVARDLPNYIEVLEPEDIKVLEALYKSAQDAYKKAETQLSSANVDYTKYIDLAAYNMELFDRKIEEIKKRGRVQKPAETKLKN